MCFLKELGGGVYEGRFAWKMDRGKREIEK